MQLMEVDSLSIEKIYPRVLSRRVIKQSLWPLLHWCLGLGASSKVGQAVPGLNDVVN